MIKYNSEILNQLFIELMKSTLHMNQYGVDNLHIPKIMVNSIDKLISKYINLISNGLNKDLILIEMEMDKIYFNKTNKIHILCLLIIQKSIFKVMDGNIDYILEISRMYTNIETYNTLIIMKEPFLLKK